MFKTIFTAILFVAGTHFATAQSSATTDENGLTWYTNVNEAHVVAQESGKPIFAFFTGSDWCGWCKKLQRDVFDKEAFIDWAKDNVTLLELDFPRRKQLPQEQVEHNRSLQQAFGVRGYPTIWIFRTSVDEETKKVSIEALGSIGYQADADGFVKNAETIIAQGEQ